MKSINDFDLSTRNGRCRARKNGFDVPFQKQGPKQPDFWSLVNKKTDSECWEWTRNLNQWGYGKFRFNGFNAMAHRVAYELHTGIKIDGLVAMHICDNPKCCNPKHLTIGTHADNQHDKFKKNRQAKGEANGASILNEEQVLEARKIYKSEKTTYKKLAEIYGVSRDTMQKAIRGIYWKHI
jgi:hypothetical protein